MEVRTIVNGAEALTKLNTQDLKSISATLKLVRTSQEVDNVLKIFQDKRKKRMEELDPETATAEENQAFAADVNALLDEEVEIKITKVQIGDLDGAKLTGHELSSILWLIEE